MTDDRQLKTEGCGAATGQTPGIETVGAELRTAARRGKIARLPEALRRELNERLREGEEGEPLLAWLNGLPEVQAILNDHFDGKAISKQNLSEWRMGGYQEWLRHRESREWLAGLIREARDLDETAGGATASDYAAVVLTAFAARTADDWLAAAGTVDERWERLERVLPLLGTLRREDHRGARVRIVREQWDNAKRQQQEKDERQRAWREQTESLFDLTSQQMASARNLEAEEDLGEGEPAEDSGHKTQNPGLKTEIGPVVQSPPKLKTQNSEL